MTDYAESKKRNELVSKKVEAWKARQLSVGSDIPEKGLSSDYKDYTPEQEVIRFAEYWSKGNYGAIAKQIHYFSKASINEKEEAGKTGKFLQTRCCWNIKLQRLPTASLYDFCKNDTESILHLYQDSTNKIVETASLYFATIYKNSGKYIRLDNPGKAEAHYGGYRNNGYWYSVYEVTQKGKASCTFE